MQDPKKAWRHWYVPPVAALLFFLLLGCNTIRNTGLLGRFNEASTGISTTAMPLKSSQGNGTPTPPATIPVTPSPKPSPTLTLLSGSPSLGDPFTPDLGNTGYDVQHYHLQLALDPLVSHISGTVRIEAITTMPNLRQISLDFIGFDISSITVNEMAAEFRREANKLWVTFPEPLLIKETPFNIVVSYAGTPKQEDSPYIHYAEYLGIVFPGNNTFYTLSEPDGARYWFPANDHPLDKATFKTELTVPQGLAAISNGRLTDSYLSNMSDGRKAATFVWQHDYPMATYLALAAGGHYLRVDEVSPNGVPLIYYYFPELEEEYMEAVSITGEAIDWMSDMLGPYPFDSYGQASYYALGISMEMQTMTLLSFQMLNERTVVHELSHSWFGNWVGLEDWGDTWHKEGLATYMEVLWLSRDDPAKMDELIAEIEKNVAEKGHDYPLDQPPPERVLSFDSYYRGALMIHALHQEIGDEAFFEGLRSYVSRYGGGSAGEDEFIAVMEEAAGRSLETFFSEWLVLDPTR